MSDPLCPHCGKPVKVGISLKSFAPVHYYNPQETVTIPPGATVYPRFANNAAASSYSFSVETEPIKYTLTPGDIDPTDETPAS